MREFARLAGALGAALGVASVPALADTAWVGTATKALPPVASIATTPLPAATPLHLIVSLKLRDKDGLAALIRSQHTPGSAHYGTVLSSAQFQATYAPTPEQAAAVRDYLAQAGFSNIRIASNNALVSADASAAAAQAAFHTNLAQFTLNGRTVYSNTTDAQVPSALGDTVLAVLGLSNAAPAMTHHQIARKFDAPLAPAPIVPLPSSVASSNPTGATLTASYSAANFRHAYDADAAPDGSGTTIAIISAGTDLVQVRADLAQAERDAGLPYVPTTVVQTEPLPTPQATDNDGEWDLDSQSSSGIAYNLQQIVFYNGAALDTGITLGANQFAADNLAKALNISIGGCESVNALTGAVATDDQAFMQAAAQGQTVFVSSGDAGAACGAVINLATPQGGVPQQVEYPASSPYVLAVGGTSLFLDANGDYALETAWTAGGGGVSLFETAPDWQASSGVVPTAAAGLRGVPDIAMNAGFNLSPAAAFYSTADTVVAGRHEGVIGTSLSSPLALGAWARMQSAHCNTLGFAPPLLYALDAAGGPASTATGFNDTLLGTNGGYVAAPGWDYTTGFGTFDVKAVNDALPAAACAANRAPVAQFTASASNGLAPVAIGFDASASSDPDGDALAWYVVDFGDGSPVVFSPSATIAPHTYAAPGRYTAKLSVRDARGAVSATATREISVRGLPLACIAPGVQALSDDAAPSLEGVDPQQGDGSDDLQGLWISEPADSPGVLALTMKVAALASVPSPYRWVTYFTAPDGTLYYAAMSTDNGPAPAFTYGIHGYDPVAGVSTFQQLGTLADGSGYTPDGTITLLFDRAAAGLAKPLHAGDALGTISASVRLSAPDDPSGSAPLGAGLTVDGAGAPNPYVVTGGICDRLFGDGFD